MLYLQVKTNKHSVYHKNTSAMKIENIMSQLEARHPGEKEYLQAVKEVLISIEEVYN